jgi:hypothetical protein
MPIITDRRTISIADVEFTPLEGVNYAHDYVKAAKLISEGADPRTICRSLILNDLFFIIYFVTGETSKENQRANSPFVVEKCQEVENGPPTRTLDVWARSHLKSSIITVAETVQYHLKYPHHCTCIFSYKKPAAEKFLNAIRNIYKPPIMRACFPDILYDNPDSESPSWSLENGITVKRKNQARPQKTVQASGLVEGMLVGDHFERRIYDDIETQDTAMNADQMDKCYNQFDMSINLGTGADTDIERVIGTYYSHMGTVVRIRDKTDIHGKKMYHPRIVPATEDGSINGKPVFLSQKVLDEKKKDISFNSQQLCDPTPVGIRKLDSTLLKDIDCKEIPTNLYKFMLVDPAGDGEDNWGLMVLGVEPEVDELGASNVYILDAVIDPLGEVTGIEEAVRMYLRNGIIEQVGVEKVGLSTTEVHIANALVKHQRKISLLDKTLMLLKPAGRNKHRRIETALSWPLFNGKIHISSLVPEAYRQRLKEELDEFPYGKHEDGIDVLSYIYDMLHDFGFKYRIKRRVKKNLNPNRRHLHAVGSQGWMVG